MDATLDGLDIGHTPLLNFFFERVIRGASTFFFWFSIKWMNGIYKSSYKASSPKRKQKSLYITAISPNTKEILRGLAFSANFKLFLEMPSLHIDIHLGIIKDNCIPGGPNCPSSCNEDFPANNFPKLVHDHVQRWKV